MKTRGTAATCKNKEKSNKRQRNYHIFVEAWIIFCQVRASRDFRFPFWTDMIAIIIPLHNGWKLLSLNNFSIYLLLRYEIFNNLKRESNFRQLFICKQFFHYKYDIKFLCTLCYVVIMETAFILVREA